MSKEDFLKVAKIFRETFDELDLSNGPGFSSGFPAGNCNRATYYIGRYLLEEYQVESDVYAGDKNESDGIASHVWLQVKNITIDITADQFDDCNQTVIVDDGSEWHRRLENICKQMPIKEVTNNENGFFSMDDEENQYQSIKKKVSQNV